MKAMTTVAIPDARPLRERVSSEEWAVRLDLAAAYRLVAHFGWDDLIFTHISARIPGPHEHFLINPYGLLFEEITASSLVKIDLDGNLIESATYAVNPAGFTIHSAIHAARHDVGCVMHLHTVNGVAVSAQADGLLPLNQTAMVLNGAITYHEYEGIALDLAERPRLVADLGLSPAMILRNHGTLTVGPTVQAAFLTMYFLERACAMQVATLAGGGAIHRPADAVQELVRRQVRGGAGEGTLAWAALVRMLDRKDSGFRE
jgi:ribulose-5-phosphate 4-epimerase/fuculose-1-phosphate aldolase